ncbi:MAG: rod shape-determining protein MreC [Acidobacteriales bacterium]|nr:rod shape-determining protein MreC [Terriglobales bacterium]
MENFFSRYRNEWILVGVLFVQVIALATQVRVAEGRAEGAASGSTPLIRVWVVGMFAPFQRMAASAGSGIRHAWSHYFYLRNVQEENQALKQEQDRLRLEMIRLQQDAEQGRRLQSLLQFREQFISRTLAAQVIGSSGTDFSKVIYVDRGSRDGVRAGMAVITPDGVVGKISRADNSVSQVMLISDPQSGAGVLLDRLRVNGVLKGTASGYPEMHYVMSDEKIEVGDRIVTTGGDRVFPKGLLIGTVQAFAPDKDRFPFYSIRIKPAVNLSRLEEVLIITGLAERETNSAGTADPTSRRAADLLSQKLPGVKPKETIDKKGDTATAAGDDTSESVPEGVDTAPPPPDPLPKTKSAPQQKNGEARPR